jgi:hypothetical protein
VEILESDAAQRSSTPPPLPPRAVSKVPPAPPPAPVAEGLDGLRALAVAANDALAVLQHAIREFERQLGQVQPVRAAAIENKANSEPVASAIVPNESVASPIAPAASPTRSLQPSISDSLWDRERQRRRVAIVVTLSVFAGLGGLLAAVIRSFAFG